MIRACLGRLLDAITIIDHMISLKKAPIQDIDISYFPYSASGSKGFVVIAGLNPEIRKISNVIRASGELASHGYRVIVISRTSEVAYPGCEMVVHWPHHGRDYFAFKVLWEEILVNLRKKESIFFLNDSIEWSSGSLSTFVQNHELSAEIVLPTESMQVRRHAQPYFFLLPENLTNSQISTVFAPARNWGWKRTAIKRGEFVFLENLIQNNFSYRFVFNHDSLHRETRSKCDEIVFLGCQLNPSSAASSYLWQNYGFKK